MSAEEPVLSDPEPVPPPAEPPHGRRAPAVLTWVAVILMLVGTVDPLEGIFLIVPGAILAVVAAFMLRHKLRWWYTLAIVLLAATTASMTSVPGFWNRVLMGVWALGELALVVLGAFVFKTVLETGHPERRSRAVLAAVLISLVAVMSVARIAGVFFDPGPRVDNWQTLATTEGKGVRLTLQTVVFWGPEGTPAPTGRTLTLPGPTGGPMQAVLENTSGTPLELPPSCVLDVVVRNEKGGVVLDPAERYWGHGGRAVMPWDKPAVVGPGARITQWWDVPFEKRGTYNVSAEVHGGPLDGIKTPPLTVEVGSEGP